MPWGKRGTVVGGGGRGGGHTCFIVFASVLFIVDITHEPISLGRRETIIFVGLGGDESRFSTTLTVID